MDTRKRNMTDRLWLDYFNRTLFAAGLITERERNALCRMIERKYTAECGRGDKRERGCVTDGSAPIK